MTLQHYTTSSGELGTLVLRQRDISSGRTLFLAHVEVAFLKMPQPVPHTVNCLASSLKFRRGRATQSQSLPYTMNGGEPSTWSMINQ